jgi:hypothetical protein
MDPWFGGLGSVDCSTSTSGLRLERGLSNRTRRAEAVEGSVSVRSGRLEQIDLPRG